MRPRGSPRLDNRLTTHSSVKLFAHYAILLASPQEYNGKTQTFCYRNKNLAIGSRLEHLTDFWSFIMAISLPPEFEERLARTTDAELKTRGMTLADMRASYEARVLRDEQTSPKLGEIALDVTLEQLDATGKRTGEFTSLSELRGKPTGLIFGSFT
jgi:hypothetical protein